MSNETPSGGGSAEEIMPQKQRDLYKQVGHKKPQVGETWYPISAKWYKAWIIYTAYNKKDEDIEGGLEKLHLRDVPKPGPIDNSELADPEDPTQLKKNLEEHLTHEWVHSEQWKLLVSWYGGGPEFPRQVYERGSTFSREKYINMHPRFLKFAEVNADGTYDVTKPTAHAFPEHYTWREVIGKFEGVADGEENEKPIVHLWLPFENLKQVYPVDTGRNVVLKAEDFQNEDPKRYVETPDDELVHSLDETQLSKDVVILIERKRGSQKKKGKKEGEQENEDEDEDNNNKAKPDENKPKNESESNEEEKFPWPLVKGPNKWKEFQVGDVLDAQDSHQKWYEAFIRYVGKEGTPHAGKVAVHFIGWASKWDEWVDIGNYERFALRNSHTGGKPHRPQQKKSYMGGGGFSWYDSNERGPPQQKGVVGLCNLGNTCFMNSTIQCLAQSPYLTEYFLKGDFVHHINYNNPLGWKGKVAEAWAQLLKDMFSNQYRVVAPRDFKTAIGEVAPRFMGYSQQDSQELLSFLLDGLHEDLNQIQQKPPTDPVESNGRPDEVVAAEAWRAYLKRNVSIIVDLLQGQYKSRVECPDCDRVSITFDPYMFLSVPLPTERYKVMEFTWVGTDPTIPPTVYGIKMLKMADIAMLKKAIGKQFNVSADDLFVCDVWKSKIHRELKNRDMIAEINRRNDDIVVFYAPKPNEPTPSAEKEKEKEKESTEDQDKDKDKDKDKEKDKNDQQDKENTGKESAKRKRHEGEFDDDEDDTDYYSQRGKDARGYQPVVPDFKTFHVWCQTRVQVRSNYSTQYRDEIEFLGMPFLVTLPMKRKVSHREVREKIFSMVRPFLVNKDKWTTSITDSTKSETEKNQDDKEKKKENDLPFSFWAIYGHNSQLALEDREDAIVPLNEYGFKFILSFPDRAEYNEEYGIREKRPRDESAPPALNRNNYDDDERSNDKAVPLSTCIDAFTEEEILDENDAWYCSKCSAFKCAKKKIDLWSSPDLLIIHLKRFSYTRQWRDRINTVVQFPVEGFDLSPWMVSEEHKCDAIYDLYGISNHMGSMGGGHYTAYAKNLENGKWYELDDSRTTEIRDVESIVSSSAYVLYYQRRKPRQLKHRASRVVIPNIGSNPTSQETTKLPSTTEENETSADKQ